MFPCHLDDLPLSTPATRYCVFFSLDPHMLGLFKKNAYTIQPFDRARPKGAFLHFAFMEWIDFFADYAAKSDIPQPKVVGLFPTCSHSAFEPARNLQEAPRKKWNKPRARASRSSWVIQKICCFWNHQRTRMKREEREKGLGVS